MEYLPLTDLQDWLEDVRFRPFGLVEFGFEAEEPHLPQGKTHYIDLTVYNSSARDSRSYDWDAETDDWTHLDGRRQSFTMLVPWPYSFDELRLQVVQLVAYAGAHEALEWLNIDGVMPHDPHVDGDVRVKL